MTPTDDEASQSVSIHAEGSGPTRMPIVGQGEQTNIENQTNFYGNAEDPDIRVELIHERDVIDAELDGRQVLSVEVTNLGHKTRELSLRAEGVRSEVGAVEPQIIPVSPGDVAKARLVLSCTSIEPEAGKRRLLVRATDTRSRGEARLSWKSNEKILDVPARPKVAISSFEPPAQNVCAPGTYQVTVKVCNAGNTRLSASLRYASHTWLDEHVPGRLADRVVALDQISFGSGADNLSPGEDEALSVKVDIRDYSVVDRRWWLPLMVRASRDEASPYVDTFDIHQSGVLSELPHVLARTRDRLSTWASHPVTANRGVFVAVFFAVLIVGTVIGLAVSPTPEAESAPNPVTTAPTASVSTPLSTSPQPPFSYEDLPCKPGTVVVFLTTFRGQEAHQLTQATAYYEHNRIWLINLGRARDEPELPDLVHVSKWSPECPTAGGFAKDYQDNHFIWYGPVPADAASTICATLRKPDEDKRCRPYPMHG